MPFFELSFSFDQTHNIVSFRSFFEPTEKKKPIIEASKDGPYVVAGVITGVITMRNSKGEWFEEKEDMALCRCGNSTTKPYCSGMHLKVGFKGNKEPDRVPDKIEHYEGEKITIHDNGGVCAHQDFALIIFPLSGEWGSRHG